MATAKANAVKTPTRTVEMMAFGMVLAGALHSSARCMVASSPMSIKDGPESPVRKQIPSGHSSELL